MKVVELYGRVRYAVQIEGLSRREAARQFGIDPRTVAKMLAFSVPPGYRRSRPPARPKLDLFTGIIDGIVASDEGRPRKQRHTSKRIFERLRDEYGYSGGITIVKDYVLARRLRHREVFVPLRHDPGHAQVDFGEAHEEVSADYTDMIYATSPTEIEDRRRAFIRKWRLKCKAVADSLEEAGDRLFTFTRLPSSQWKSARTTNAIERLHEEFKRRIKTQTVLPSAETAAMLFWALLAAGQITMRKVDGWETLDQNLADQPIDLAA